MRLKNSTSNYDSALFSCYGHISHMMHTNSNSMIEKYNSDNSLIM